MLEEKQKDNSPPPRRAKAKGPRGRKKEKGQISVRIEKNALDLIYAHSEVTREPITAMMERALVKLVIDEMRESHVQRTARFLVIRAKPEEARRVTDFMAYLRYEDPERIDLYEMVKMQRTELFQTFDVIKQHRSGRYEEALRSYHPAEHKEESGEPAAKGT